MGIKTIKQVIDDATGKEIKEDEATVIRLSYEVLSSPEDPDDQDPREPKVWELYFSEASLKAFDGDVAKYTKSAELVVPAQTSSGGRRDRSNAPRNAAIRSWWKSLSPGQRVDLGLPEPVAKGRIVDPVVDAFGKLPEPERQKWIAEAAA